MVSTRLNKLYFSAVGAACGLTALPAMALPEDGKLSFQPPATPLAEEVKLFHDALLLPIITVISLFVLGLLMWVVFRYNSKANPVARKFSHNTTVEVLWTGIPILILLVIALPSFELLYKEDVIPDGKKVVYVGDGQITEFVLENDFAPSRMVKKRSHVEVFSVAVSGARTKLNYGDDYTLTGLGTPQVFVGMKAAPGPNQEIQIVGGRTRSGPTPILGMFGEDRSNIVPAPSITIKATGFQWYWQHSYPDFGDFEINSVLMPKEQLEDKSLYLLATDNNVVVPEGETIRIVTTAADVIHAWAMPQFAVKVDAVPGRLNETWFQAPKPGMYYGQCSEICGLNHAYMPIALEVKSREAFRIWVAQQQELAGIEPTFPESLKYANAASASDAGVDVDSE